MGTVVVARGQRGGLSAKATALVIDGVLGGSQGCRTDPGTALVVNRQDSGALFQLELC